LGTITTALIVILLAIIVFMSDVIIGQPYSLIIEIVLSVLLIIIIINAFLKKRIEVIDSTKIFPADKITKKENPNAFWTLNIVYIIIVILFIIHIFSVISKPM
jgi:hypothetical protein